ncbi:MAG: recombinase family protein [Provencibacterium sp.]|jgi:site-specific DNA recombinase|nr:recombinase family protein [Provencibacterium sp.]
MKNVMIYSRKSKFTGKGESIENQVEMCREYARRQFTEEVKFSVYEDEGFSGKNTVRPEFQRMMADMRMGGYHILMCYRLDRISRSVSDFSVILEELQARGVDFISIKEQFDTTTPMGRAMIHIASVFAELERETIAERIRDNKYKQYRNGHWQGGIPPLGYESEKVRFVDEQGNRRSYQRLRLVPEHAELAWMIFDKYIALGSYSKLESYLMVQGIRAPGGSCFLKAGLRLMLANPVYAKNDLCVYDYLQSRGADMANSRDEYDGTKGVIAYGKTVTTNPKMGSRKPVGPEEWVVAIADHEGIIDGEKWVYVQTRLDEKRFCYPRQNTSGIALLSALIRCQKCGGPMEPGGQRVYADGTPGFYYICSKKKVSRGELCDCKNIKGVSFDNSIIEAIQRLLEDGKSLLPDFENELMRIKTEQKDFAAAVKRLKTKAKKNQKAINRLAAKLADSDSPENDALIFEAMRSLREEEQLLQKQLGISRQMAAASRSKELGFEIVREAFGSFVKTVDQMGPDEKKEALRKLIRKIEWNGKEATIYLKAMESGISFTLKG